MLSNSLLLLNAVLRVYHSNFLNLHWNSVGEEFNDAHKNISTDYYELCDKYIDSTAEMVARLGVNPYNYRDAYNALGNCKSLEVINIDTSVLYNRKSIIELSDKMLGGIINILEICLLSEELEDVSNTGIRSDLEAMHSEIDLQYRYINKRRMM